MAKIEVNSEKCKSCELCITVCPLGLIKLSDRFNSVGEHFAEQHDADKCTGCTLCAMMCPDFAIEVYE